MKDTSMGTGNIAIDTKNKHKCKTLYNNNIQLHQIQTLHYFIYIFFLFIRRNTLRL